MTALDREDALIALLHQRLGGGRQGDEGIGDDGCRLRSDDGSVVVLDTMVEGVHFRSDWSTWSDIGWKLLATNVSDLYAMGAQPRVFLLSLSLPQSFSWSAIEGLVEGLEAGVAAWGPLALVGGDTTGSPGPVVLSATIVGAQQGQALWSRSRAIAGASLYLDGPVGWAAAGLAVLRGERCGGSQAAPFVRAHQRPDVRTPAWGVDAHACIDVSDGLARDAWRLARASGTHLYMEGSLPGEDALLSCFGEEEGARVALEGWQWHGGDDYVRLWAAPAPVPGASRIGWVERGPAGVSYRRSAQEPWRPVPERGWTHFGARAGGGAL